MATAREWLEGARPRTLPAAVAPVAAGTGAAGAVDALCPGRALLALLVAIALQVGVNYANDYSDGVRGTDAERTGPLRLVGSGLASPHAVRAAALVSFGFAAVIGLVLAALTTWWLLLVGAIAIVAAWFYTGGSRPYGYRGLGEVSVFVFFGLVATAGTTYVQAERITATSVLLGVGCGAFACAILVANNLRDLDGDQRVGKVTLAVRLGDRRTRWLYAALMATPYVVLAPVAVIYPAALAALVTVVPAVWTARTVLRGARGPDLVAVLKATGLVLLAYGVLLLVGLAWLSG
jgi:1,4-dihydroxy-2-naphthoate polyprenyltransferase